MLLGGYISKTSGCFLLRHWRMDVLKRFLHLLLLTVLVSMSLESDSVTAEARPLPFLPQQKYSKILATLGVACKCCDGIGGECSSTWKEPCSKLQCLPWKLD